MTLSINNGWAVFIGEMNGEADQIGGTAANRGGTEWTWKAFWCRYGPESCPFE